MFALHCLLVLGAVLTTGGHDAAPFFPPNTPILVVPSDYLSSYLPAGPGASMGGGGNMIICPGCPHPYGTPPDGAPRPETPPAKKPPPKAKTPPVEDDTEDAYKEVPAKAAVPKAAKKAPKRAEKKPPVAAEEEEETEQPAANTEAADDETDKVTKDLSNALLSTNVPGKSAVVMKSVPGKPNDAKKVFFAGVVGGTDQDIANIAKIVGAQLPKSSSGAAAGTNDAATAKGATAKGATAKGTDAKGADAKGADAKGAAAKGTTAKGATAKGAATNGAAAKGTAKEGSNDGAASKDGDAAAAVSDDDTPSAKKS